MRASDRWALSRGGEGPHLGELNASAQGEGGLRPVLKSCVALQIGDQFVAKQTFISSFRNGMNAVFISL